MAITDSKSELYESVKARHHNQKLVTTNCSPDQPSNMDPKTLDFEECLKDSPKFRQSLKENLTTIENLEACMSKTLKHISSYIETGREHIQSQKDFTNSMRLLNNTLGEKNSETCKRVNTLLDALDEVSRLHEIVIDQSVRTVGSSFTRFISDDLLKIKEARKSFDKISHEYDQALAKHSQPVKKQQDDSENLLIATSTAFTHTSLDLSIQLTSLQSKKGYDILDSLLSFLKAHNTFFHQGSDLFEDLKPHINEMDDYTSKIQDEFELLVRSLPSKHLMVSNNELRPLCFDHKSEEVHLEGYLFKKASNGFKVWNRRWFILRDHQLLYQKRGDFQPTVMEEDLRLLTVRPIERTDSDRRFCFEVLSPQKSHILQADTESARKTWISALQAGINAAFHDTEHKIVPKSEIYLNQSSGPSSWTSNFSLKALHHQATSKLNSITNANDAKEPTKPSQVVKPVSTLHATDPDNDLSGDEQDEDNGMNCKTDDQGRSYVPLREDDEELSGKENQPDQTNSCHEVKFPKSALDHSHNAATTTRDVSAEPPEKPQRAYMIILAMPGNDECADCGAPQPKWASINLGITLCIECAGIHRSLGVHLSKVRSLTLDTEVWSPQVVELMLKLGNTSVNSAYLSCYRGQIPRINADSCREERENWIKAKYLQKSFMQPPD